MDNSEPNVENNKANKFTQTAIQFQTKQDKKKETDSFLLQTFKDFIKK